MIYKYTKINVRFIAIEKLDIFNYDTSQNNQVIISVAKIKRPIHFDDQTSTHYTLLKGTKL